MQKVSSDDPRDHYVLLLQVPESLIPPTKKLLDSAGISVRIETDTGDAFQTLYGAPSLLGMKICVLQKDLARAREIVGLDEPSGERRHDTDQDTLRDPTSPQ